MNILLLTYSSISNVGGVERCVYDISRRMKGLGHDVTVVMSAERLSKCGYSVEAGIPVFRLRIPDQIPYHVGEKLTTCALNAANFLFLAAYCSLKRVQVVHCHFINMDSVYAVWLRRLPNVKSVLTLHGSDVRVWSVVFPNRREYALKVIRGVDTVTAVSNALANDALSLGNGLISKPEVIGNGVDTAELHKAATATGSLPKKYFVFVGRLEPIKDVGCLLDAYISSACASGPEFPDLVIVGGGGEYETLKAKAADSYVRQKIIFLGSKDYGSALGILKGALALVLPSLSEGCPYAVLEAMALGVPVIVSSAAGNMELVGDGQDGLVFPVMDREKLGECLTRMAKGEEMRRAFIQSGLSKVERSFELRKVVDKYLGLYERVTRSV